MRRALSLLFALGLPACACDGAGRDRDAAFESPDAALPDAPGLDAPFLDAFVPGLDAASGPDAPPERRLASGVTLEGLALFQGVRVELASSGSVATARNAPVLAARDAVVRAYVSAASYPRTLRGELEVREGTRIVAVHTASATVARASTDADPTSVLAFDVPARELTPTASLAVRVVDPAGESPGASHPAQLPRDGSGLALGAQDDGEGLHLVLVPLAWNSDGSGRLPDTSDAWLMRVRALLTSLYPLVDVRIDVHAPVPWSGGLTWSGSVDFGDINAMLFDLRETDGAPPGAYYYALVAPDVDFDSYCGGSCVTGQSYVVSDPADAAFRVGSGVGFGTDDSAWTLAHELGHEHGRYHAPCGTSGDRDYPYAGGGLGVWGFDPRARAFLDPSRTSDFMGYCDPQWISDYTWSAIFTRTLAVSALSAPWGVGEAVIVRVRSARPGVREALWVGPRALRAPRTRERTAFAYLDAGGRVLVRGTAPTVLQSHDDERVVVLPAAPPGAVHVEVDGVLVEVTRDDE
ncbi:MAG: hypothetical protein OHK0013_44210 [Sandaracinaceae bacterium]